jgi:hypothetical protein
MFKKILQTLSRSQTVKTETPKQVPVKTPGQATQRTGGVLNPFSKLAATAARRAGLSLPSSSPRFGSSKEWKER